MIHFKRFIEDRALTFELDRSFALRSCNPNFRRYLAPEKSFLEVLAEANPATVVAAMTNALAANLEWSGELAFATPMGILCAEVTAYPMEAGFAGIGIDVTEQSLFRKKLLGQLDIREKLIKLAPVGVFLADGDGTCYSVNDAWKTMTGLKLHEAFNEGWRRAVHPDDRESVEREWDAFTRDGSPFAREYRYQRGADMTYVFVKAVKLELNGVAQIFRLENDLTPVVLRDQQMERQRTQLEANARLAALGVMASGISHEINNPLTVIDGMAEILTNDLAGHDSAVPMLEKIKKNVERIQCIIRSMKALSRDAKFDPPGRHDLRQICDEVLVIAAPRFRELGVELRYHRDLESAFIICQASEIEQVLLNLLNNALDAVQGVAEKWIEVRLSVEAGKILLLISDSGPGIPEAIRRSIFNPFFTTKAPGKGTGLGLSISKTLVAANSAELYLDEARQRTTFVLSFPEAKEVFHEPHQAE
jgi:PAS domain S-box-containing protein